MVTITVTEDRASAHLVVRLESDAGTSGLQINQTFYKLYDPPHMGRPRIDLDSRTLGPESVPALIDRLNEAKRIADEIGRLATPEEMRAWAKQMNPGTE